MKNIYIVLAIALVGLVLYFINMSAKEKRAETNVNTIANKENLMIIDNRTLEEYNSGHIDGAILMPYDQIQDSIAKQAPDKKAYIALYCRSGKRAGIALQKLKAMGYENVENFGGINQARAKLKK